MVETPIDVPREAVRRLLIDAHTRYRKANETGEGGLGACHYWTGYIRALQHVLEMEDE